MKVFVILLIIFGFIGMGISFELAFAEPCDAICILGASWDGTEFVDPGETYWLDVKIPPTEKLHVKILYYDDSIVLDKIYTPDENGLVRIQYTSPDSEDAFSYYRVAMHINNKPDTNAGTIFRIGDTYGRGFFPVVTQPYSGTAKVGDTLHLHSNNNNRWGVPMPPHHTFNVTLYSPSGNMVHHQSITTDELGNFEDSFTIMESGFYKLVLQDKDYKQIRYFPKNFDTVKTITAEGKDFELKFGFQDDGIMFNIDDIKFDQNAKSLKIIANNPTHKDVRFQVLIPHEFLNGNMTTMLDGSLRPDISQKHILGYSNTVFSLPPGNHTVQIVGTSAIPEFQTIAVLVLASAVIPIILLRKQVMLR